MFRPQVPGLGLLVLLAALVGASPVRADPESKAERRRTIAREVEADLLRAVDRIRPATVSVLSREARRSQGGSLERPHPLRAVGTGVLVRRAGSLWVLTSLHVVDTDDRYEVITADGAAHPITVRARKPSVDLALLGFAGAPPRLEGVDLDEGADVEDEGTWVLATGNPFFLALDGRSAVSLGVVSGQRPAAATSYIQGSILQHDAEINPGSSGGPLWDTSGRLVGVNGTIATRSRSQGAGPAYTGASFAVPISLARVFVAETFGEVPLARPATVAARPPAPPVVEPPPPVVRSVPFLGIRTRTQVGGRGAPSGARVTGVIAPSPVAPTVESAGIRPGDVITELGSGGRAWSIRSSDDVEHAVATLTPGVRVTLRFVRGGRILGWTGRLAGRR